MLAENGSATGEFFETLYVYAIKNNLTALIPQQVLASWFGNGLQKA